MPLPIPPSTLQSTLTRITHAASNTTLDITIHTHTHYPRRFQHHPRHYNPHSHTLPTPLPTPPSTLQSTLTHITHAGSNSTLDITIHTHTHYPRRFQLHPRHYNPHSHTLPTPLPTPPSTLQSTPQHTYPRRFQHHPRHYNPHSHTLPTPLPTPPSTLQSTVTPYHAASNSTLDITIHSHTHYPRRFQLHPRHYNPQSHTLPTPLPTPPSTLQSTVTHITHAASNTTLEITQPASSTTLEIDCNPTHIYAVTPPPPVFRNQNSQATPPLHDSLKATRTANTSLRPQFPYSHTRHYSCR
ncbi:hypothetical protein HNY73_005015 [Argiope bruennichi]|uniref:Uncharacterized protein n=1 Tax=Argiope bruennichi TaxID=94029 RepID=A0A8T0FSH0_ARGBR|nr:hypothetical protein HNY73_005015 [Argiope bruennichi]